MILYLLLSFFRVLFSNILVLKTLKNTWTDDFTRCAMALVHSRVQRVYYGSSDGEGALGSRFKVHVQPGLNHHYMVFQGVMKEQCDTLYHREDTWVLYMCE